MSAVERAAGEWAGRMEAEARRDAPWQDRSGQARRSIKGVAGREGDVIVCGVSGGMAYSPALELADEGRGAVLGPVVRRNARKVLEGCGEGMG